MYYNAHHGQDCTLRGGMTLRFCTENEEQRKWKTSLKVNRRHVPKTTLFGTRLSSEISPTHCLIYAVFAD
jgi:hypothetical protein